ncbi:interleukin-5 receptor subunit alpha-like isoform X2 [Protopterus annectens]|uniref:interleukin-5 receptor subunit alpha-like isoform X2 n=1 Tax=Protopterus annectens TaxID=7888 RepID=UPI001CF9E551|nr:interleukin-5 receptor subunit alpha-like isoform X2 [Protopterus annectens]
MCSLPRYISIIFLIFFCHCSNSQLGLTNEFEQGSTVQPTTSAQQESVTETVEAPVNFTITSPLLGRLLFRWETSLQTENITYTLYIWYLDKSNPVIDLTMEDNMFQSTLALHRGIIAKVKTVLRGSNGEVAESNWTQSVFPAPPGEKGTFAVNLECVIYNITYLNCTWKSGKSAPKGTQYFLYYRQEKHTEACNSYTRSETGNIRCHTKLSLHSARKISVCVNGSSTQTTILPYYASFTPLYIEKIVSPQIINISAENQYLLIKWTTPKTRFKKRSRCFDYQVKIITLSDNSYSVINISQQKYLKYPFESPTDLLLKIRAKINIYCTTNKYWSDWNEEIYRECPKGSVPTGEIKLYLVLTFIAVLSILSVGWIISKRKILQVKLFPPIPDPTAKIKVILDFCKENAKEQTILKNKMSGMNSYKQQSWTLVQERPAE